MFSFLGYWFSVHAGKHPCRGVRHTGVRALKYTGLGQMGRARNTGPAFVDVFAGVLPFAEVVGGVHAVVSVARAAPRQSRLATVNSTACPHTGQV
jgi:phage tail tape-measure protein